MKNESRFIALKEFKRRLHIDFLSILVPPINGVGGGAKLQVGKPAKVFMSDETNGIQKMRG
jgi:hypothetical protein